MWSIWMFSKFIPVAFYRKFDKMKIVLSRLYELYLDIISSNERARLWIFNKYARCYMCLDCYDSLVSVVK